MVSDDPESFADLDGHDSISYYLGFINAYVSDNMFGLGRNNGSNPDVQRGQGAGDKAALAQGVGEAALGATGVGGGTVLTLSVVGAPEGVATVAGSTVLALHGAATATVATTHLLKSGSGPKADDAPGVTSNGQATDEHGNKLTGAKKPQVNESGPSNTREAARNKALDKGAGAVEHSNPRRGDPHFHPTDKQGEKKPSSTHFTYKKKE